MSDWKDDSMKIADVIHSGVDRLMWERNLLYGTIIYLMISNNMDSVELPPAEVFESYGKDYYVLFDRKEGTTVLSLMERPDDV